MAKRISFRTLGDLDDDLKDYEFSRRLSSIAGRNNSTKEDLQATVRSIVKAYGWNPAKYPQHTAYTFWSLITGDSWGQFRKKLIDYHKGLIPEFDETSPDVVKYFC